MGTGVNETVKYETRMVKTVRGMESRTAAKWEAQEQFVRHALGPWTRSPQRNCLI